jgi:adenosylcobinamide-phosphate synthase
MDHFEVVLESLPLKLVILTLALALDLLIGEPPNKIHPTVIVGKIAERLRRVDAAPYTRLYGSLLASTLVLSTAAAAYLLLDLTRVQLGQLAYLVLGGLVLKTSFAIKSMNLHTRPVMEALVEGDLPKARDALSKIVRRDTRSLSRHLCASAAIESIAEGTVDGIVSPLFYFFLFGVPGAVAFRAVNTLDSMVGYKDEPYTELGWFSAKLDTISNYIPARLTAGLILAGGAIMGRDWRSSLSVLREGHGLTESVNAGWPMSAMAGVVGVQLMKRGSYRLGPQQRLPNHNDIAAGLRVMWLTTVLFTLASGSLCLAATLLFTSWA